MKRSGESTRGTYSPADTCRAISDANKQAADNGLYRAVVKLIYFVLVFHAAFLSRARRILNDT